MIAVNFYLKNFKSTKETPINLVFNYGVGRPFKFGTGIGVLPSNWNADKQRIREKRGVADSVDQNAFLEKMESLIKTIYTRILNQGCDINNETLRDLLNVELGRKQRTAPTNLSTFLDHIVKIKKEAKSTDARIVKMAADNLKKFCLKKKEKLDFKDMNLSFRDRFYAFLCSQEYKQNSISTCFSALRIILIQAQEDGLNPYNFFRSDKFSAKTETVKKFALSESDLMTIHNLDLSKQCQACQDVRDTFLIGSFTLMRFSDYSNLAEANVENDMIYRKTQKTDQNVVIPLHWVISEILAKRNGKFPPSHTNETTNKYIRRIAELAKLNNNVVVSYTKGGIRIDEVKEKWQMITSHAARRSGIRMMRKAGIERSKVMMFSGHKSESAFNVYADVEEENNAIELASLSFFKKALSVNESI